MARPDPVPVQGPDLPINVLLPIFQRWIDQGAAVCLSWTCPACSERIIWPVPNVYTPDEYTHHQKHDGSPCGHPYTGELFGMTVLFAPPGRSPPSLS